MLGSLAPVPQPAISAAGLAGATAAAPSGGGRSFNLILNNQKFPVSGEVDIVIKIERALIRADYARATGPLPAQKRQR